MKHIHIQIDSYAEVCTPIYNNYKTLKWLQNYNIVSEKIVSYALQKKHHDDDVYLEYYSGKGFHINYSVYISYVKHIIRPIRHK
jgi:hypothetical protein